MPRRFLWNVQRVGFSTLEECLYVYSNLIAGDQDAWRFYLVMRSETFPTIRSWQIIQNESMRIKRWYLILEIDNYDAEKES